MSAYAPPPLSEPVARYEFTVEWWLYGDYDRVVVLLTPLLLPDPPTELTQEQLIDSYFMLGASHFFLGNRPASHNPFYHLLLLEPDHEVDRFLYPPTLIREFDQVRENNSEELDRIRQERAGSTEAPGGEIVYLERRIEERSILVSMIPFGVGHFANDDMLWGGTYLILEVALGATSAGFWLANELALDDDGFFHDRDRARTRAKVHFATGIAFFSVVLLNVVHGILIHEDVVEISYGVVNEPEGFELEEQSWVPFASPWAENGWLLGIQRNW